ncbi:hypothetical protein [Thermus sp.]|uniref:hypothetical protein n=1 Tax=Thermus sp. TaxID=275 RepID=UPI003D130BED
MIDEFTRIFNQLFPDNPQQLLKLGRALVKVAALNYALALEDFIYQTEEKFLKAAGISRELVEQMARVAED